ncbi:MAG: prepilin-type N-terminal cleavage/methylation domain-containing protein [Candidatus Omnitrophica bacterium]|nr:prepilin-type N-terminal cleavage/methylation domain-containing protein [Candidatus Omnitrophota bacterium]
MRKKKGSSLVEIIVATVILSLVMLGMVSLFVAGKRHVIHSRDRMSSSQMGKFFLDPLQMYVRQDKWAGNPLGMKVLPVKVNNVDYTGRYVVSDVGGTNLRRVIAKISWDESTP